MNTTRPSIEYRSKPKRLSVRIAGRILSEPFFWLPIGLTVIYCIFGG